MNYSSSQRTLEILLALCLASIPLMLMLFLPQPPPVHASTITVTNTNDSGGGSLRDVISTALPGDTIVFSLTYPATITLTSELAITKNLTINGPSPISLTISGSSLTRVISVSSGITLNLSKLTIANGNAGSGNKGGGIFNNGTLNITTSTFLSNTAPGFDSKGGGIFNNGVLNITNTTFYSNSAFFGAAILSFVELRISDSAFYNNSAADNGGGISHQGTLTIINSTFSGNSATAGGGGIADDGTVTISNTTFSGNSASFGGGIWLYCCTMTITNTTFYSNTATSAMFGGGGIFNDGKLTMTNSTLVGNSAPSGNGGGIYHDNVVGTLTITNSTFSGNNASRGGGISNFNSVTVTLYNTIVANNIASTGANCSGSITDVGNNLQWNPNIGCGFALAAADPKLAPLGNYGGPTQTMALLAGSAAIDAGNDVNCPSTDQRGVPRPQGAHCDIGAYEAILLFLPIIEK